MTANGNKVKNPALDLEKYDGQRRRSSALEAKGFPTITEAQDDVDDKILLKKQSVKRVFGYPITIPFIISNEFCERFSYYGMRTILTIYMTEKLMMSKDDTKFWYHEFVALCYATPVLGAIVADVFLGKYLTILILSIVYCIGNAVMAITAVGKWFSSGDVVDTTNIQPQTWGPLLGLQIIALGTGGIKPCVSSFGGDQFLNSETGKMQRYFAMFYFSINAGSLIATALTPELRTTGCMGESTCYPIAFGVPAIFMVLAVIAFLLASRWYVKVPPMGNPIVDVAKVSYAMVLGKSPEVLYGAKKVAETKQILKILMVFIPFPFFWALFEQQGSLWILQAKRMNGALGSMTIKPDQMQVFNPLLILCLIPVFETLVYPTMKKLGLPTSARFRMVSGMVLVASSFVICGFVELSMEERVAAYNAEHLTTYTLDTLPVEHQLHILATIPQIFVITCGEILCSITALEFAYAYAPTSMKSVCQACFLLTNAFGNIIVMILSEATINRDLYLYFMWAGIEIGAALLMFLITAKVIGPLERFKQENSKEGTVNPDDIQMEKAEKK